MFFSGTLSIAYAVEEKKSTFDFFLPVNVLSETKEKTKLAVKVPDTFKPVADYTKGQTLDMLLEFIPLTDKSVNDWSKIITIKSYPGLALKSNKEYLDTIVEGFKQNATKSDVLEGDDKKQEGFEEGYRLIAYTYNNRDEMVYIYTASGPKDTAMVQYAIKVNSPSEIEKVKTELKEFITNNVTKVK